MPHYHDLNTKPATPGQARLLITILGLVLVPVAGLLCAITGAALAAGVANFTPAVAVGLTSPLLCPAHTASARLDTVYGDYSTSNTDSYAHYTTRDYTTVLRCYDTEGAELAGKGPSFTALWWGAWTAGGGLLGALACAGLLIWFSMVVIRGLPARSGGGTQASPYEHTSRNAMEDGDLTELGGLQKLDEAERRAKRHHA